MTLLQSPAPDLVQRLPMGDALGPDVQLPEDLALLESINEPLATIEPLVATIDAYYALEISALRRASRVRSGLVERLIHADRSLPPGFRLVVLDGWRSIQFQQRLVEHYSSEAVTAGYVADPASSAVRPPHVTGGAVDLTLAFDDTPLALGTDFDALEPAANRLAFEAEDSVVRRLRRLLERAMRSADFTPYPLEWWHWSYGEDVWAVEHGCAALYDLIPADIDEEA